AVYEIDQAIFLPQHTVIVEGARSVADREVEAAGLDLLGRRNPPLRGHDEIAGPLATAFQHVDLRRPAAITRKHPERRPNRMANRHLGADFEIAVLLRERALRG